MFDSLKRRQVKSKSDEKYRFEELTGQKNVSPVNLMK